jgi:hypothetical protein
MITDKQTLQTIRTILASEKPADIAPLDLVQMVYFTSRKSEDHDIFDSQQTLARRFNVDAKTIKRSQEKLAKLGWISRPQRRGKTRAISIRYQNLPCEETLRLQITPDAQQIAVRYQRALQRVGRRKFPKQWLRQQFLSAQRVLNECNGDVDLACALISHALSHPGHRKKSKQSLYNLYGRWPKILSTYSARLQEQEMQRQRQETIQ